MNKKALLTGIFLMAILGLCFLSGEKTIYGISEGTYELSEEIEGCVPVIHFDMSGSELLPDLRRKRHMWKVPGGTGRQSPCHCG